MNRHKPHLLILPEDEHDHRLANGFAGHMKIDRGQIQILNFANGWRKAQTQITSPDSSEIKHLHSFPAAHLLVVLDFDEEADRLVQIQNNIPAMLQNRVYIIGIWDEPKTLRQQLKLKYSFEEIGAALLEECLLPGNGAITWEHSSLQHNQAELQRFKINVCPFLVIPP